jgi:hypothetical protein
MAEQNTIIACKVTVEKDKYIISLALLWVI